MAQIIYTDGSCIGNKVGHGKGGYGFVVIEKDMEWHVSGGEENTTNNRMELKAVIESLLFAKKNSKYIIYSDSMYVINCAKGIWKRSKNLDIWKEYDNASKGKNIEFIWVKGHSNDKYNEIVDKLAKKESME